MSRLFVAALSTALLLVAVPAFAQEAPTEEPMVEPTAVATEATTSSEILACDNTAGLAVLTADGLLPAISTPSYRDGNEVESVDLLVDLAASSVETATVSGAMTWSDPANDYDLEIESADTSVVSEGYQPLNAAEESASLDNVAHCDVITVNAVDFFAPQAGDAVEISLTLTGIAGPKAAPGI